MDQHHLSSEAFALSALAHFRRRESRAGFAKMSGYDPMIDETQADETNLAEFWSLDDPPSEECAFAQLVSATFKPASEVPSEMLMAAFRLGEVLKDKATFADMASASALTVLETGALDAVDSVVELLEEGYIPLLVSDGNGPKVRVLHPKCSAASASDERVKFAKVVSEALQSREAIIIVVPDRSFLSPSIANFLPPSRCLPAPSKALILALLRQTHALPSRELVKAIASSLPPDVQLRLLSPAPLAIALRQETPLAAAQRIAENVKKLCAMGPMLDAFDPKLDAVMALRNMLSDISAWQKDSIGWDEMQHSLLISGPTGTGKTYLARAMANTSGLPLIASSFADWQRCGNLSDTLKAMHATFQEAREKAPVILFLDEIDSVGSRAHRDHNSAYTDQVINAFLIQMDGTMQNQGVLIIAATNHLSAIDPAVLRPGRFDKIVELGLPDLGALQHIVATAASGALIFDDVKKVARAAVGSSAATVDGAVRAAKSVARRANTDLSANLIIAELSPSAQNAHLERRIALHECGHAALALLYGQKVRHIRLGNDTGEVARKSGAMEQKLEEYEDELAIVLGGRAAEKILTGEISGGAGGPADSDIGRASTLALDIELRFGLGQHGNLWAPMPIEIAMRDPALKQIVAKSIERAYARALTDIARLAPIVRDMAKALIDARELSGSDLDDWILRIAGSQTKEFSVETGNVVAFRRLHG